MLVIICTESKIRYDVIVFDEAGQIRSHTTADTIRPNVHYVLGCLRRLIGRARHVLLMQYQLSERDVDFYTSQVGIDGRDRTHVRRWVLDRSAPLHPLRFTYRLDIALAELFSHFNEQCASAEFRPFLVLCTSVAICRGKKIDVIVLISNKTCSYPPLFAPVGSARISRGHDQDCIW